MCGICGKISWQRPVPPELISRMCEVLVHRGPDASGTHLEPPAALGHRRLSIIDLREIGNQPMADHTGRYWIVYNGEIYNFHDLRKRLEAQGAAFRSNTDTEVILEAYKAWGTDCLRQFNGMFAFALWDREQRRLFLARDRLGKKPLYYYRFPDGSVTFASELPSLCSDPEVPVELNLRALRQYLALNYVLSDECMVRGVEKLPAAHYLVIEQGKSAAPVRYWDLASHFRNKGAYRSVEEAAGRLNELLEDATRLRLISDVPLGAFLSGGIDSSAIVAAMCRIRPPDQQYTFSIGFRERTYSEIEEARLVADALKVRHRDEIVEADMARILPRIMQFTGEPFADTSMIPMFYLAEFARRHVTVCLSGDGGDEVLAGYETYVADRLHHAFRWIPGPVRSLTGFLIDRLIPSTFDKVSLDYKLRQFVSNMGQSFERAHYGWRQIYPEQEIAALCPRLAGAADVPDPFASFEPHFRAVEGCHYVDRAQYVDIKTWLVDDILVKVDRTTMAHALEARNPFLDHRVVEFGASLPVGYKLHGLTKKYVLRRSQRNYLPASTIHRAKKGFNSPVAHWLQTSMAPFCRQVLDSAAQPGALFSPAFVGRLWEDHKARRRDNSLKLFSLINFELWKGQIRELRRRIGAPALTE